MEIYINNEKLDFQLEDEKNLKQVIEAVNDWLFQQGKVIDQIVIDEKVYNEEIEHLEKVPVEDVKILRLTIIDIDVLVRNSLTEIQRYLSTMLDFIKSKEEFGFEEINKIIDGIKWVIKILEKCNRLYKYSSNFKNKEFNYNTEIEALEKLSDILEKCIRKEQLNKSIEILKNELITSLEKWVTYIDKLIDFSIGFKKGIAVSREKVAKQIYNIITKIPDMLKLIEVTAVDLQSGAEKEAMKNIQVIVGTLESIVALLQVIKTTFSLDYNNIYFEDKSVEEFNKELREILNEMVGAMENKDTVLIADLIEYELSPRLERYIEILKLVAKEVNLEIN